MTEAQSGTISFERYTGTEEPFAPGADVEISATLTPISSGDSIYYPPATSYTAPTYIKPAGRPLILNVETTGLYPWESRIISIGVVDPGAENFVPTLFQHEQESTLLAQFFEFFEAYGFNEIIGYNVSFDMRFMFAAACRYRFNCPALFSAKMTDLEQVMKQVQESFVFGYNKSGTLDQWAKYFFNMEPPTTQEQVLFAFSRGDIATVGDYNIYKVEATWNLFMITEYVKGSFTSAQLEAAEVIASKETVLGATEKVRYCTNCGQQVVLPINQASVTCAVCNTVFKA